MKSSREKIMLLVVAPLAVMAIYTVLYASKQAETLKRVEDQAQALRGKGNPLPQLAMKNAKLNELEDLLTKLRGDKARLAEQWATLAGANIMPGHRAEKVERLTGIFKQYGLVVIEQGEAEAKDTVPQVLEPVAKKMAEAGDRHKPQLWKVHIAGSYGDLLGALKYLAAGDALVIPLGVSMKEANVDSEVREWTLLMWV